MGKNHKLLLSQILFSAII